MKKEELKLKTANGLAHAAVPLLIAACLVGGCVSVKTEHEIKPIHITLDVNLKVEKELEEFLSLD